MAGDESGPRARRKELVEEALRALGEAEDELRSLVATQRAFTANARRLSKLAEQLSQAISGSEEKLVDAKAWKQIRELNANFSLRELALHQAMDEESRLFTSVSNILKTRHDTAKNSISNIR